MGEKVGGDGAGEEGEADQGPLKREGNRGTDQGENNSLNGKFLAFFFFLLSKIRSFLVSSDRRRQRGKAQRLDASLGSGGRSQSCERIKPTRYIPFPLRGFLPTQSTYLISTLDKKQGCLLTSSRGSASSTLAGYASDLS